MTKIYGTIKRGKVKINSKRQLRFLFAKKLPFTIYTKKKGKRRKKRMNVK